MFKQLTSLLICTTVLCTVKGQNRTENFKLILPKTKVPNSIYRSIEYQDVRLDPSSLGIVQLGLLNSKAHVGLKEPFEDQLQNVINSYIDSSAEDGKLLFVVRRFIFREVTKATSETGYFYIRGSLFANENETYRMISDLDTIIQFKAMDVTQRLLRTGSKIIVEFIGQHLQAKPSGLDSLSHYAALHIDSIRKLSVPVYNVNIFKDGVYRDYDEFKAQSPGITDFRPVTKSDQIKKILGKNAAGEENRIDKKDIYAVVTNGKPFIATRFGFYPLEKKDDDFYYTGKIKAYNPGAALMGGILFGLAGAMIAGSGSEVAHLKLDYVNGMFVYAGTGK